MQAPSRLVLLKYHSVALSVSGDDCTASQICYRRRLVPYRHDQARDQTVEKVFLEVLSSKLLLKIQKSEHLHLSVLRWVRTETTCFCFVFGNKFNSPNRVGEVLFAFCDDYFVLCGLIISIL